MIIFGMKVDLATVAAILTQNLFKGNRLQRLGPSSGLGIDLRPNSKDFNELERTIGDARKHAEEYLVLAAEGVVDPRVEGGGNESHSQGVILV
jgi:hypothetical protein